MSICFENYQKENAVFSHHIEKNIQAVVCLKSEYDHERYIEEFEKEFAEYNGSLYVVAVNSGTTALSLALSAVGVTPGDEVLLPAYTYISTALAVSDLGAIPVFVDIKADTLTMDPEKISDALTRRTKAIIPVHIHGNPCDMDAIVDIAQNNQLAVIEDCSHAHGAEYAHKKVGNFGIGCFSCHTGKVFSGLGNGGLVTLNDEVMHERIRARIKVKNDPDPALSGRTPCKMDAIQAAILKAKLPYLDRMIKRKRIMAQQYKDSLPADLKYQHEEKRAGHVYRDFVVLTEQRTRVSHDFKALGIGTKIRYAVPLHRIQYYQSLMKQGICLPVTDIVVQQALCLPIFYGLSSQEAECVCDAIQRV